MYLVGTSFIVLGLMAAVVSSAAYALVVAGRPALLRSGRIGAWCALGFTGAAALLLLALLVAGRYDVRYVHAFSASDLEVRFRVAALWAGQSGSLILWALAGLICTPFLMRRTREWEPAVLAPLLLLHAVLIVFMLIRNPFVPTDVAALAANPTGVGLNPQLHNIWMIIHPPTLFAAYGFLSASFCMAVAGLWRRDYHGWVRLALPWTLAGWALLATALAMGAYWAYESLGWGGYWAWDPVENSALVPWLVGTALIHGMLVQQTRGGLQRANVALAFLTYGFIFYGSFLTRSGVLGNFSVHSFVEAGLEQVMLGALAALLGLSGVLLAVRWRDIPRRSLSGALLSRDTAMLLMIVTFVTLAVVVAAATSLPWISSMPGLSYRLERDLGRIFDLDNGSRFGQPFGDGRFGLMPDFFKRTTPPLALVLATLMAVAPLLGWRSTHVHTLLRRVRWPGITAVVGTSIGLSLGVRDGLSIAFLWIASFALGSNVVLLVGTLRQGWLRVGGYLSHVGMALLLVGVLGSYGYASNEVKLVLPQGGTQHVFGHSFTFWGNEQRPDGRNVVRIEVDKGGTGAFVAVPEVYGDPRSGGQVRRPAIKRSLWQDVYIAPESYLPPQDPNLAEIGPGQAAQIGPYHLRFDGFDIQNRLTTDRYALIGANVTITFDGTSQAVVPQMRVEAGKPFIELPALLPEGRQLVLENFNTQERLVRLRVEGLHLPVAPSRVVFTVSLKPAIALVWLGAVLIALGGTLAVARRHQVSKVLLTTAVTGDGKRPWHVFDGGKVDGIVTASGITKERGGTKRGVRSP